MCTLSIQAHNFSIIHSTLLAKYIYSIFLNIPYDMLRSFNEFVIRMGVRCQISYIYIYIYMNVNMI